jgi:hypothetical protein
MRGPEPPPVIPAAYDRVIKSVKFDEPIKGRDFVNATIGLDQAVPFGTGTLVVDLKGGRRIKLDVITFGEAKLADPTTTIRVQAPLELLKEKENLQGQPARFYSDDYPPEAWREAPKDNAQKGEVKQTKAGASGKH